MALTDTTASKKFIAGAPDIILKGDYRREKPEMKMASEPDIMDERNELSLRLFGKELKLLTPEEMDILDQEAERLMQKFMADGGRAEYGLGSIVKGVKEIDMRETGGFIPPVGVKEKADDIPAMLSNNEFVFTADAVRAAGGGSVNKGAQRMYDLMKNLESKVV